MRKIFQRFNSIFGRLALLSISVLILTQLTWVWAIELERAESAADHISRMLVFANNALHNGTATAKQLHDAFGLVFIGRGQDPVSAGCPAPCHSGGGAFERILQRKLPAGSRVAVDFHTGRVWVGIAPERPLDEPLSGADMNASAAPVFSALHWAVMPADVPERRQLIGVNATMLLIAILIALFGAWQIQRPLLRLARAARELRAGHRPAPLRPQGPSEVKALIEDFNEMSSELSLAEQERAVMLAGVAHDLRAPLTRIQVRASLVDDQQAQAGFIRDATSLSQIVTQFLDFARDAEPAASTTLTPVDAFCRTHYAQAADDTREALIALDLHAGEGFRLPEVELDRILSNLIENAFTYGAPPLLITTARRSGMYTLTVRDHGNGIADADLDRALRPFVRLDAARGGDAHCGLGLTIVRRLARRYGGDLSISNAAGGGLAVALRFPV